MARQATRNHLAQISGREFVLALGRAPVVSRQQHKLERPLSIWAHTQHRRVATLLLGGGARFRRDQTQLDLGAAKRIFIVAGRVLA